MIHQPKQYYVIVAKIVTMKTMKKLGKNVCEHYPNKAKYKVIYIIMITIIY